MKFIAKNICLITSKNGNLFCHKNSSVIKTKENGLVLLIIVLPLARASQF